jgi:hypothetical protein
MPHLQFAGKRPDASAGLLCCAASSDRDDHKSDCDYEANDGHDPRINRPATDRDVRGLIVVTSER